MLFFSAVGLLFTYAILRFQAVLPFQHLFNPQNLPARQRASRVQHRGQFHDEYELAELRRRIDHELFLADGRADIS